MILGESLEDYLETLLILDNENGKIRCVDVAKKMDVSKPSVNKAMNVLKDDVHPPHGVEPDADGIGRGRGDCDRGCLPD